jgi:hypothetical protein
MIKLVRKEDCHRAVDALWERCRVVGLMDRFQELLDEGCVLAPRKGSIVGRWRFITNYAVSKMETELAVLERQQYDMSGSEEYEDIIAAQDLVAGL